jgi:integrase
MGRRPDGRRDRRHVRGRTRAQVTVKVRALERQRDDGLLLGSGWVPTVGEWVRFLVGPHRRASATPQDLGAVLVAGMCLDYPVLGRVPVGSALAGAGGGLLRLRVDHGLAASLVLLAHHVLSGALQAAVRGGLVVVNVCRLVETPRRPVGEVEPLTLAEVRRLLDAATSSATGCVGHSRSAWDCGRVRRWGCCGAMSTWRRGRCGWVTSPEIRSQESRRLYRSAVYRGASAARCRAHPFCGS